jgi:phosphoribosylformylglycinamidine cyclo-ligase
MPTKIYVSVILKLLDKYEIKGISHITGGGFIENIPRMIPKGLKASINKNSWTYPAIFEDIKKVSGLDERHMFNTFNMGIGMVLAVDNVNASEILSYIKLMGEEAYIIGKVSKGREGIELC